MGPTETLRPRSSRAIAVALASSCVLALAAVLASGSSVATVLRAVSVAALVASLAWAVYWRPEVEVSDGGIRVVNPWRTVHVPWPALAEVSERWSFTVRTTDGQSFSAFAAPAGGAMDRSRGVAGQAARVARERLEALRAAGFLDEVRPEGAPVTVSAAVGPLAASAGSLVLLALSLLA